VCANIFHLSCRPVEIPRNVHCGSVQVDECRPILRGIKRIMNRPSGGFFFSSSVIISFYHHRLLLFILSSSKQCDFLSKYGIADDGRRVRTRGYTPAAGNSTTNAFFYIIIITLYEYLAINLSTRLYGATARGRPVPLCVFVDLRPVTASTLINYYEIAA